MEVVVAIESIGTHMTTEATGTVVMEAIEVAILVVAVVVAIEKL
jgi:hypothetical protein